MLLHENKVKQWRCLKRVIVSSFYLGNIPHSARPPSFNFSGARLTFVTKLHRNEYTGRKKNFQEEMRHFNSYLSSLSELEILGNRSGEAYARRQLQELRKMKEKLSFRKFFS